MRLSSSSLEMASARISCSVSSAKRFTPHTPREIGNEIRTILNSKGGLLTSRGDSASLEAGRARRKRMQRVSLDRTRRALEPALRRLMHVYWRFARAMTLGVRALVVDEQGRVFLVRHSYVSGWHLPGGGVEAGETLAQAVGG